MGLSKGKVLWYILAIGQRVGANRQVDLRKNVKKVMKKNALLFLFTLVVPHFVDAQSFIVPDYKSPQNQCNYLIVTPTKFLQGAQNLAQFRQSFSGYKTGVVLLDTLYAQFDSVGRRPYEKLWWGLRFAYKSWSLPPKMVVLMGADSLSYDFSDSTWHNYGNMPAAVYQYGFSEPDSGRQLQPEFDYSDDYYAALKDSKPQGFPFGLQDSGYAVIVGRIPCDSSQQCVNYVQKVIDFENNRHLHKSWFNSAMVVSDDTMQGLKLDRLGFTHLKMAEECADSLLRPWFVTKVVGCAYAPDSTFSKPTAEDSIVNTINRGNLWSIYIGHGFPDGWSDEHMLLGNDVARLRNDSTPSLFVAFACSNADYIKSYNNSMCKQFLFAPQGGAIAYIGATCLVFATDNARLMGAFFDSFGGNPQLPLGQILVAAKTMATPCEYNIPYAFLGDPALTLSDGRIHLTLSRNNQGLVSFACQNGNGGAQSGNFDVRIYKRDTVRIGAEDFYCLDSLVARQTGMFSNSSFSIALADSGVRVVAFVWNASGEGRMDSSFLVNSIPVIVDVKKSADAIALRIENGRVFIRTGTLRGTTIRLDAFAMNGKVVMSKKIAVRAPEITIDPRTMGLGAGVYVVRLTSVKAVLTQRMILTK